MTRSPHSARCYQGIAWLAGWLLLPLATMAQIAGDFAHTNNDTGITITGYTGPGGYVTVPDRISDRPVTEIGEDAFYQATQVTGVTIPDSVVSIRSGAFILCSNLTSLSLGGRLEDIADFSFRLCSALTNLSCPASLTNIGFRAFASCAGLRTLHLGSNVASLGASSFDHL